MRRVGRYDIEDPSKIQGRDEVSPSQRNLAALRLRRALAVLRPVRGKLLLLGCGAGRYARALTRERPDLELHGGDLSLTALREARARDRRTAYVALDSSALPYRAACFDAVVFFDLLEHVPAFQTMLDEIHRVLKPGGLLHCFVPVEGEPGTVYYWLRSGRFVPIRRWKRDHVGHVNRFCVTDVLRAAWQARLRVTDMAYSFHLMGQVHDVVDYWQRERNAGGRGLLPYPLVGPAARTVFLVTWRLSYLEDRFYAGPRLASGLHLTAVKPA